MYGVHKSDLEILRSGSQVPFIAALRNTLFGVAVTSFINAVVGIVTYKQEFKYLPVIWLILGFVLLLVVWAISHHIKKQRSTVDETIDRIKNEHVMSEQVSTSSSSTNVVVLGEKK